MVEEVRVLLRLLGGDSPAPCLVLNVDDCRDTRGKSELWWQYWPSFAYMWTWNPVLCRLGPVSKIGFFPVWHDSEVLHDVGLVVECPRPPDPSLPLPFRKRTNTT
jgi:hypothetical protein